MIKAQNNISLNLSISYIKRQKQNIIMQQDKAILKEIIFERLNYSGFYKLN